MKRSKLRFFLMLMLFTYVTVFILYMPFFKANGAFYVTDIHRYRPMSIIQSNDVVTKHHYIGKESVDYIKNNSVDYVTYHTRWSIYGFIVNQEPSVKLIKLHNNNKVLVLAN